MKNIHHRQGGQALVILLVFMLMAITVTTASVIIIMVNSLSVTRSQEGILTDEMAESGAENALLRLLRDPSYTGETLTIGTGNVTVVVTGTTTKTIISTATSGDFVRKVQVVAAYTNGIFAVTSWQEVF